MKDFYRVKQLSWLKMKPFPNFESSTHSVGEKWPIEFVFIVMSLYAQTYPLANQIYVYFASVDTNLVSQRINLYVTRPNYEAKLNRPLHNDRVGGAFKV